MPIVSFDALPDTARVWVFGAASPVTGDAASRVLQTVDEHLAQWRAHGVPLVCARDWREDRFLAIAVDEAASDASGCSIDALFHVLQDVESELEVSLVPSGLVYWRDPAGQVVSAERAVFRAAASAGNVGRDTPVFDTLITTVGDWRGNFERPAGESWHRRWVGG
ncbi:MAG: hypothetical protein IBJ03_06795 [Gemmatimonadaceae bacterium]|nr:hypothetical protein [Gemmatimonadaceae bacterium]